MKQRVILSVLLPLLCLAPALWLARYLWSVAASPQRAWRLAIAMDQLANAAANGDEDETISSRAARAKDDGKTWGCVLCRLLDVFDKNHCEKSKGL